MSDYISKSELIEAIKQQKDDNDMHCRLCMDAMIEIAEELPTLDEKEIIRKAFDRVVKQLNGLMPIQFNGFGKTLITLEDAINVVKEVGGIE